jgi:putative polyhydroxyalkanoate system protein
MLPGIACSRNGESPTAAVAVRRPFRDYQGALPSPPDLDPRRWRRAGGSHDGHDLDRASMRCRTEGEGRRGEDREGLNRRFELDYAWSGDHVDFERPGVSGRMLVGKDKISLDVNLGWLLTPLKPAIEREITAQLDKLLGKA